MLAEKVSEEGLTSDDLKNEVAALKSKRDKKGGRKKEYNFKVFYNRMTKTAEWLNDDFVEAFEAGDTKIGKKEIKELETLAGRIGAILEQVKK